MPKDCNQPKPQAGKFTVEIRKGRFFVIDPDGVAVVGPIQCENKALMTRDARQRSADAAAKRMTRPCMCCGQSFESEGIHNRLCNGCRHRSDGGSMGIPAASSSRMRRTARM